MSHYETLGVSKDATPDDIKKAYRRLASQHHPDKGGDTATFQQIQAAYETLSDSNKRAEYDNPQPQGGFHFHQSGGVPPGFEDIFASMFGGRGPFGDIFGQQHRQQPQRNHTLNLQTLITLEEAHSGKELISNIKLPSGRESVLNIKIPPGVENGTVLRLREIGDDTIPNIPRGDVHLSVHVQQHPVFERQGDDLITEVEVSAFDAMLGKELDFTTLDKRQIKITVKPGTQPNTVLGAQGYGMPNMRDPRFVGRLLMKVKVVIPTFLTDEQKELIKTLII